MPFANLIQRSLNLTEFLIKRGEKIHGPFSESQISAGLKSKKLSQKDRVSTSRSGPWGPITTHSKKSKIQSRHELPKDQTRAPNSEIESIIFDEKVNYVPSFFGAIAGRMKVTTKHVTFRTRREQYLKGNVDIAAEDIKTVEGFKKSGLFDTGILVVKRGGVEYRFVCFSKKIEHCYFKSSNRS